MHKLCMHFVTLTNSKKVININFRNTRLQILILRFADLWKMLINISLKLIQSLCYCYKKEDYYCNGKHRNMQETVPALDH